MTPSGSLCEDVYLQWRHNAIQVGGDHQPLPPCRPQIEVIVPPPVPLTGIGRVDELQGLHGLEDDAGVASASKSMGTP
eukprot:7005489-Heterocapsa_arctica.AAC.1